MISNKHSLYWLISRREKSNWKSARIGGFLLFLFLGLVGQTSFAQVKIGGETQTIDDGAILQLESTDKAFVPPRMTTKHRDAIPTPLTGAMIYNLDLECLQVNNGTSGVPS